MRRGAGFWYRHKVIVPLLLWILVVLLGYGESIPAARAQGKEVEVNLNVYGDIATPTVPTNLSTTLVLSVPQVVITWDPSTDDSGIYYYSIFRNAVFVATTTATSFTDTTVSLNSPYTYTISYTVSATDLAKKESARSATSSVQVPGVNKGGGSRLDTDPPTTPKNLSFSPATSAPAVTLTWDPSSDDEGPIAGYRIYRDGVQIADVPSARFTDATIAYDARYSYTVVAYDQQGNLSAQSAPLIVAVPPPADTQAPAPPARVAATVNAATPSVRLTWDAAVDNDSGVAGYRIYRNGTFLTTVTSPAFIDTFVSFGTGYTYAVAAFDAAGNVSALSLPVSVRVPPDTIPPSVPFGVTARVDARVPAVRLSWGASADNAQVVEYQIYRDGVLVATAIGTTYTDAAVALGGSYSYTVVARDAAGNLSSPSSPVAVSLPESAPSPEEGGVTMPGGSGTTTQEGESEARAREGDAVGQPQVDVVPPPRPRVDTPLAFLLNQEVGWRIVAVGFTIAGMVVPAIEIASLSAASGASFWYALLLRLRNFGQFLSLLFPWLGLYSRRKPWGTVYDSVTKQPLDPVYVELLNADTGEEIASVLTDLDGRYGFTAPPGRYVIRAQKTNYLFPSRRLSGKKEEAIYQNLYFGEVITVQEGEEGNIIIRDIPMDPERFDWNEFEKRRLGVMRFYSRYGRLLHYVTSGLFYGGFLFSLYATWVYPGWFNYLVVSLYLVVMALRRVAVRPRAKGAIIDAKTGAPLSFAVVKVFIPGQDAQPVKKVLADGLGRYYCLVHPGEYYVVIERLLPDGTYRPFFRSNVFKVKKKKGIIDIRWRV